MTEPLSSLKKHLEIWFIEKKKVYLVVVLKGVRLQDVSAIWKQINKLLIESDIVLDGGNVVHRNDKAILCDKIFKENPKYSRKELMSELQ